MSVIERFANETPGLPAVRGFLHRPENEVRGALVLTHGAGSNCGAPLLVAVAESFAGAGFLVLRCDLPFRQARPHGPPTGNGAQDRAGLRRAAQVLHEIAPGRVFLGGHSYGGRQASMLAAEDPSVAHALLLLSYPLHPPGKPQQLRTAHLPKLRIPALFVHGSRDPFGALDEMHAALGLISAPAELLVIEGAGHDLSRGGYDNVALRTVEAWGKLMDRGDGAPQAMPTR
jgi:predicted alpha/beta-hydrolase family hydrolase